MLERRADELLGRKPTRSCGLETMPFDGLGKTHYADSRERTSCTARERTNNSKPRHVVEDKNGLPQGKKNLLQHRTGCFAERDELAFSRVLREFHPEVMFFDDNSARATQTWIPNISHATGSECSVAVPAPGQDARWQLNLDTKMLMVHPLVRLDYQRSRWEWLDPAVKWAFDPPLLDGVNLRLGIRKTQRNSNPLPANSSGWSIRSLARAVGSVWTPAFGRRREVMRVNDGGWVSAFALIRQRRSNSTSTTTTCFGRTSCRPNQPGHAISSCRTI